jgi:hypothetical protein
VGVNGVVHGLMIWIDETSRQVAYQYTQTPECCIFLSFFACFLVVINNNGACGSISKKL